MESLLTFLSAGGDIGIWVMVAVVWRFDRRLLTLETLFTVSKGEKDKT